ncbi:unnamed protein product [Paramecium primaurelia]|uniref:Right handed beta helix domain-containing protein n=1 Tax=Paramecium primaurelia TaxID=5886 RepID=A0A8S1NII7_PARPR|nr:unnamed protein product [Paramecium primaurelia]
MSLFLLLFVHYLSSLEVKEMDSLYQYCQQSIILQGNTQISSAFRYGLWSKYNPLTSIIQVGNVGLFDSNCFHLHSAVEELSLSLNLIYYDCIDDSLKKISKTIAFIDNNDMQNSFTIDIDPFEYENIWYFFEILQCPFQERFELLFIYQQKTIRKQLQIKQPFKDQYLKLIFGGSMIVKQSKIQTISSGTRFSYFPGKLIKVEYEYSEISIDDDQEELARIAFEPFNICNCKLNKILRLNDNSMKQLDNLIFTSENINCNSFLLSGWLKITDIIQNQDEFIYQFLMLSSNFQNQLSKKSLSPFTLSYKISPLSNQIIVTTYSYIFPSVTINNSDNDHQIIQKEFDILNSITLWQKLTIQLIADQLIINIKFYEDYNIYEYNTQEYVKQFSCTQFKLQYGNIQQQKMNYLNILFRNFLFNNCDTDDIYQSCHYSCQECDGPSKNNCLSCTKQRIYLHEYKACVCPFNTIDQESCISYLDSGLELSSVKKIMTKCKYGYFEYDNLCIRCPSIINNQVATCQECLQNPSKWSKEPYCENDLFFNQNGDVKTNIWYGYSIYFLFDENDLIYCKKCNSSYSFIVDEYDINNEITLEQQYFLFLDTYPGYSNQLDCLTPYYQTFQRKCNLCPILNCKYCFEYQTNDLSKCTLYNDFENFDSDQEVKIGCALCEQNYIFDFDAGICVFNTPKIQNCLRSYIYHDQEVCTLSQIDDFNLAPEIINCQNYQPYCLQCIQSPEYKIKCIICQIGYITSITTGGCYLADYYKGWGVKIMIEGVQIFKDGWIQRIQSFMMKFLPNNFFYFQAKLDQIVEQMIVECIEGYQLVSSYQCSKYCDPSCLNCKYNYDIGYYCNRCPLNQYYQPIRDQINGKCSECSQLCSVCQIRTNDEINNYQQNFIINDQNFIYTKKCLKQVQDPQIYLDPYDQIAKYCFDQTCSSMFLYQKEINYCYWFDILWQQDINIEYFNKLGIDSLIIQFIYTSLQEICVLPNFQIDSLLKTKIFSLKFIHFILSCRKGMILQMTNIITLNNIDKLEINQIIFRNIFTFYFYIQNNNAKTELHLFNVSFLDTQIKDTKSIFQSQLFGDVKMINVQLQNIDFQNSSFFNLTDFYIQGIVIIENFTIRNCTFYNSNIFSFINNKVVLSVKHLLIEECSFKNSYIYVIDSNIQQLSKLDFDNVTIKQSNFINSSLLNCNNYVSLSLINFQFQQNTLISSNFFTSNYNLSFSYIQIIKNQFLESQFIFIIEKNENISIFVLIDQFEAQDNQLQNSKFLKVQTNQESCKIDLVISNLVFNEITSVNNSDNKQYLFKIRCFKLKIQDLIFRNLKNIYVFNIFEGNDIIFSNIIYENSAQIYQLPFSYYCQNKINEKNQLLKIENFFILTIISVQIINQFTIDESFIDLQQKKEFTNFSQLEITNLIFIGNLQIFKESPRSISLLALNTEWSIDVKVNRIKFLENCFHSLSESFLQSYASLLFLNMKSSNIQISNFLSEKNAFINSSNSFVYINSKIVIIQNLQISNHNVLTYQLWERFYGVKLDQFLNQQQINQFAFQTFNITNIGGVGQITTSMFTCLNCKFSNILASKSAIFEINTVDFGIIKLIQIIANDIISDLKQHYSQNSLLDIKIQQSVFKNIFNRMSSSILSIQPSKISNMINLTDIQIYDCLSLMNQILIVQFSNKIIDKNNLEIRNIIITQNMDSWISLFSQIGNISFTELLDISSSQNSLFYAESCSILIINISLEGLYLSPILNIVNTPKLILSKLQIKYLQRFFAFNLIIINQIIDIQSEVVLHQINIFNSSTYQADLQKIILSDFNFLFNLCVVVANQTTKGSENQPFYFLDEILNTLEKHTQILPSLIYIQSLSKKHSFYFNQLEIVQNDCKHCNNGLILFNLLTFYKIKIQELNCNFNIIKQYGCLKILDENQKSLPIKLLSSNFIQNSGSQGIAISSNSPIIIKYCNIIQNKAIIRGGGIYLQLNSNQFHILNSIIILNQAKEGGGIYLSGNSNLNQNNFIKTYLLFNQAYDYANNLVESPTHLSLIINSLEMQVDKYKSEQTQTFNRMSSSILSIQPSKISNMINLTDIQIYDCLSLMNQILIVQFSNKIIDKNNLEIRNIIITQNMDSWISLFSQIGNISFTELLDISSSQNSLFYAESCSILIINISLEGLYLSPILNIVNTPKLILSKLQIKYLQRFFAFNLIIINQIIDIQSEVVLHQINIFNSSTYQADLQKIILSDFNFLFNLCVVVANQTTKGSENQPFYFLDEILNTLEKHTQILPSLIYIQSLSKKHSFYFNQLEIVQNDCKHCNNGLILFNLLTFYKIKIQELNCNFNIIKQYGCLKILDENQKSLPIKLLSSNFIQNSGSQGIAISSNSPIIIKYCNIIQNKAIIRGGGIYLQLNSNQFHILNSIIILNQAKEGGGIYLSGNSNLNQNNFIKTYLLFNQAYDYANNLVESPTHLSLIINSLEMQVDKYKSEQTQTNILRIFPYFTIEQEVKIKTYYLKIPSGRSIQDFQLSIPKISQNYKQIKSIELIFKNNLNEQQKNLNNSTCSINENIVKKNEVKIDGISQNQQLFYNHEKNNFDLSSISITIDPYNKDYKYLEISIICQTQEYKNPLKYIIQAKSYKCQLGEFYVDNRCQICESNQGFYSVTYDSIKCSIFDKEKFQEITSNQIKLLEGYWRPNYLSDQSTLCFKRTKFCLGGWNVGDAICSEGHVGALCEECDIYNVKGNGKFIKNQQNSECFLCFGNQNSIIPFILNTAWAILSIILTLKSIGKSNDLFLLYKIQGSFNQILFKLNQDLEGILIKMLINYLWIFSVIFTLNISFSFQFNFVDQASNQSYSMANNLDCYLSEIVDIQLIYSKIILILILILMQFMIIIFGLVIFSILIKSKFKLNQISNTLLCLYIFNYAGFIKMLCSLVSYREISTFQYISGDLTLKFNTETHHQWIVYLVLPGLIIFGCLIPLSLFLLMYFHRNGLDNYIFRPHICYLYNEYEKESYYWEQIKLSKRAIMILILTYFETKIHLKASLIGLSLIIYQLLAIKKKPYMITKFNKFDLQTGQICSVSIFLSAIKYESEQLNNIVISLALQICLMVLFLMITFPFIDSIVKIYYKKYKLFILKYLYSIFKYFRLQYVSKKFEVILQQKYKKEQRIKDNFLKLRRFLMIVSKIQIKNRPAIQTTINSIHNYQQKLLSTDIQGQSMLLTGQRLE